VYLDSYVKYGVKAELVCYSLLFTWPFPVMGPERPAMVTAKHYTSFFEGVFPKRFSLPILISKYYQRAFFQYYKHRVLNR